jgi:chromate transporter
MRLSLLDLARCFLQVSFSSVGGAQAPLRFMLVSKRKWLTEEEFAETFGICQTLPGAVGANVALMVGDRYAGWRGAVVSVLAFSLPAMVFAVFLAMGAIRAAAFSPRVAHAEIAVAAAAAGLSIGLAGRLVAVLWKGADGTERGWYRALRLGVTPVGLILVVGWHLALPYAVVVMLAIGLGVEALRARRLRGTTAS